MKGSAPGRMILKKTWRGLAPRRTRGPEIHLVDGFHAQKRVQHGREKGSEKGQKNDGCLAARPHQDRQRHPRQHGDGPQRFQQGEGVILEGLFPAHEQPDGHAQEGGQEKGLHHAPDTLEDVDIVFWRINRNPIRGILGNPFPEDGYRAGQLLEPGELQALGGEIPNNDEAYDAQEVQIGPGALEPLLEGEQRDLQGADGIPLVRGRRCCVGHGIVSSLMLATCL